MAQRLLHLDFPVTVKWYITGRCNLRCRHCYLTDYTKEVSLDKILEIIDYLATAGTRHLYFLGGEPLFRKDFPQIVKYSTERGFNILAATNAILLTEEKAIELKDAGLKAIQISLDSPFSQTHESLRGKGTFQKTINGIKNAKRNGLMVNLAFVANRQNHSEVFALLKLANELQVDTVRIMPLIPIGTAALDTTLKLDEESVASIQSQVEKGTSEFPNLKVADGLSKSLPQTAPSLMGCGAGTTHMIINSDLTLSACDLGVETERTETPINTPEQIKELWTHHSIFNNWRNEEPGHCPLGKKQYPNLPYF